MTLTPSDFFTDLPIGEGRSRGSDVRRLRHALARTGYGDSLNSRSTSVTPALSTALENFQRDFGLRPDAIIRPGGPTERALSMAVRAGQESGAKGVGLLRDSFARRAETGLLFRPHPRDRAAGLWLDEVGNEFTDHQADAYVAAVPQSKTQMAMLMKRDWPGRRLPGQGILDGGGAGGGGGGGGTVTGGQLLRGIWHLLWSSKPDADKQKGGNSPKSQPPKRSMLPENFDVRTPPSPATPPPGVDEPVQNIPEEPQPWILVTPPLDWQIPSTEGFPDMSDLQKDWMIVYNSRGLKPGQALDMEDLLEIANEVLAPYGIKLVVKHGAFNWDSKEAIKELFLHKTPGVVKGGRRPDVVIELDHEGNVAYLYINIQDTWKDGITPKKHERDANNDIENFLGPYSIREEEDLSLVGDVLGIPKSKHWNRDDWKEWLREFLSEYFRGKYGAPPKK